MWEALAGVPGYLADHGMDSFIRNITDPQFLLSNWGGGFGLASATEQGLSALGRGASAAADGAGAAESSLSGLNLGKQLASEEQTAQVLSGKGAEIIGGNTGKELNAGSRLADQYGGNADDWAKVSSSNYKSPDGTSFETHAYQNSQTGQVVEPKTKFQ